MRKQTGLLVLFSLFLVSLVSAQYYPYGGSFGFDNIGVIFDQILNFLQVNEYLVDAIVFLVVYLIIAKKVFSSFSQDKILYSVIGIALTIGLIMYERKTGYSFVVNSGPFAIAALVLLGVFLFSKGGLKGFKLLAAGLLYIVLHFWLTGSYSYILYSIPSFIPGLLLLCAIIAIAVGLYQMIKGG